MKSFVAIGAWLLAASAAMAEFAITPAVVTGDAAPGGGVFSRIEKFYWTLGAQGQVVFEADPESRWGGTDGIWDYQGEEKRLIARAGMQAAGMPEGNLYAGFYGLVVGENGRVAFNAYASSGSNAIWAGGSGGLELVAESGKVAAGSAPPRTFRDTFFEWGVDAAGNVGFHEGDYNVNGGGAIWSASAGSMRLVAGDGAAAPGTSFNFRTVYRTNFFANGEVGFSAELDHNVEDTRGEIGVWVGKANSLQLLAREGTEAPGMGGVKWNGGFATPVMNASGTVLLSGWHEGDAGGDQGIWVGRPGNLRLLIKDGDDAPGTNQKFTGNDGGIINDQGKIAFVGRLESSEQGIWTGTSPEDLKLIVQVGDAAPGAQEGVQFESFWGLTMNNRGQILFQGVLTSRREDGGSLGGYFAADESGELVPVVMVGDWLEVRGMQRQVEEIIVPYGTRFLDDGTMAFFATFTDGTEGIFTARVPEPAQVGVLVLIGWCAGRRPRHKGCAAGA